MFNRQTSNIHKHKPYPIRTYAFQQYGINNKNTNNHKILKSKSKSNKDILIAKNKKLNHFFHINHTHSQENQSLSHKSIKQHIIPNIHQQNLNILNENQSITANKQYGLLYQKTSFFGNQSSKINKQNHSINQFNRQSNHIPQTLQSDRVDAFQITQRLKKSTSMKNLIQQRFLSDHQQQKTKQPNVYTSSTQQQAYDSTKYNWRLSKSKQKLQRQKSCSLLSSKSKLICQFNKINQNKNKLKLHNTTHNNNQTQKITKHLYNVQTNNNQQKLLNHKNKTINVNLSQQQKLSFTFGSDVLSNFNFN